MSKFDIDSGEGVPVTRWNGEPCDAEIVRVIVGKAPKPTWWCADLEGTEREAVKVTYEGTTFYLDNEDGSGWAKVTAGRGGPSWGHSSLPDGTVEVATTNTPKDKTDEH